ncbi:FAD-dependent oxidoreductase [Leptobacterium flavescens]|uniref:FAD-dependent oxidoreductase n=1 Tax=Leptobacterium flavescens TaxID=472055 RepID=A0A6P0USM8_9FLAO|nr:FAD-dependent oxidoreductase [Leptobacterium flavescens]
MVDYIVVGLGLAGISFCELLERENRSFVVFDDASQQSSGVAGGLYNPVILKRFTKVWKAKEQLQLALPFYKQLEEKLDTTFDHKIRVLRRFVSVEEQNGWFEAADKPFLTEFMSTTLVKNENACIDAPFGFGEVLQTGRVDSGKLQEYFRKYLEAGNRIRKESFDHALLEINDDYIEYCGQKAKQIVFAEGYGLKKNPFFNYLPLNGTKGELLTIKAPELKLDFVLKSSAFIIPIGNDIYKIGATYEWHDKTNETTQKARTELLDKLKSFLKCDFEIVDQQAGIRPTVTDRRPLVGKHPLRSRTYLLNGMGSRGVMIAPYISLQLLEHIEKGTSLDPDIDIKRFEKKHFVG